jgi:hypothetical protein
MGGSVLYRHAQLHGLRSRLRGGSANAAPAVPLVPPNERAASLIRVAEHPRWLSISKALVSQFAVTSAWYFWVLRCQLVDVTMTCTKQSQAAG